MFCTKCGNQIADNAMFCPNCGNKLEADSPQVVVEEGDVIVKSKKELIYGAFKRYMTASVLIVGVNPTFGELEQYEEGANGMVYCELVASTRNALGKTKKTRFGAVIKEVEEDGNVVFKGAGPQLMTPWTGTGVLKKVLGFKKLR